MGEVYTDILLKNAGDVMSAQRGNMPEQEIHRMTINILVDTGTTTLVINEAIRKYLGLNVQEQDEIDMANGTKRSVTVVDPVEIHWKNRSMVCRPWVIPDADEALLGLIPLEDMGLIVDPVQQELVGRYSSGARGRSVGVRKK